MAAMARSPNPFLQNLGEERGGSQHPGGPNNLDASLLSPRRHANPNLPGHQFNSPISPHDHRRAVGVQNYAQHADMPAGPLPPISALLNGQLRSPSFLQRPYVHVTSNRGGRVPGYGLPHRDSPFPDRRRRPPRTQPMVQSMRPLSPFSITQEAPPLHRNRRANAAWHDPLPDPLAPDDSIDEGQPFAYERQSRAGPSTAMETSTSFADPQGLSYERFRQPQSSFQAGSSTFPQGPSSGPAPTQAGPSAAPGADSFHARQTRASFPSPQGFRHFRQPRASPAGSGEPPASSDIPLAGPPRERSMPDINGLRLSPTIPSVDIGMDQNVGRIVEPPTWGVRALSPLAYSTGLSNNDVDGGEEEQDVWEEGVDEDTYGDGEEREDEGDDEGEDEDDDDDIDDVRDGGRWAPLDRFSEKFDSLSRHLTEVTANIRNIETRLQNMGPATSTLPVGRSERTKAPKLTTTPCHASPLKNTLHMEVRKHLMDLLEQNPEECFVSLDEAEEWAQGWNPGLNQSCCTIDLFRVDLHAPRSAWNKSAARIFVLDFARFHQLNDMTLTAYDKIEKAFFTRMRTLRSCYMRLQKPNTMRISETQKLRRYARRRALFLRRLYIADSHHLLRRHVNIIQRLGVAGMSDDESETEELSRNPAIGQRIPLFYTVQPRWRMTGVTEWLHTFDAVYMITRRTEGPSRGAYPRVRFYERDPPTVDDSKRFVADLPKNAYNATWLAWKPDRDHSVRPQQPEYDFSHDPGIFRLLSSVDRSYAMYW